MIKCGNLLKLPILLVTTWHLGENLRSCVLKEEKVRLVTKWTLTATGEERSEHADLIVTNTSVLSKGRGQD